MVLAYLVRDYPHYRDFYAQRIAQGAEVILDNGAAEFGVPMDFDTLMKINDGLGGATVVVCPDYPNDINKTLEAANRYLPKFPVTQQVMVVPQGATRGEWMRCALHLSELVRPCVSGIHYLGISKFTFKWGGPDIRLTLWQMLHSLELTRRFRVHLLGLHDPRELWAMAPWIHGCDTSLPIALGLQGFSLSEYSRVGKVEMDFAPQDVTDATDELIVNNVNTLYKEYAGGYHDLIA
jgi:hypothetical protein